MFQIMRGVTPSDGGAIAFVGNESTRQWCDTDDSRGKLFSCILVYMTASLRMTPCNHGAVVFDGSKCIPISNNIFDTRNQLWSLITGISAATISSPCHNFSTLFQRCESSLCREHRFDTALKLTCNTMGITTDGLLTPCFYATCRIQCSECCPRVLDCDHTFDSIQLIFFEVTTIRFTAPRHQRAISLHSHKCVLIRIHLLDSRCKPFFS